MEQIELTRTVESVTDDKIVFCTRNVVSYTMDECVKILPQHEAKLITSLQEKENLAKLIGNKFWEKEAEDIDNNISKAEELVKLFTDALKPYFEVLIKKGRLFIGVEKKKQHYDRMTKGEAKVVLQVKIRNECRAHLGLDDILHPVMLTLREEFEKL